MKRLIEQGAARLAAWLRIWKTEPAAPDLEALTDAGLLRLAETSPHLLEDIGFAADPAPTPERQVWRRGGLAVVARHTPQTRHHVERPERPVRGARRFDPARGVTLHPAPPARVF